MLHRSGKVLSNPPSLEDIVQVAGKFPVRGFSSCHAMLVWLHSFGFVSGDFDYDEVEVSPKRYRFYLKEQCKPFLY